MTFYDMDPPVKVVRTERTDDDASGALDPDIANWRQVVVNIWPFAGAPTTGTWPMGWIGIDNTAALWVCSVGGTPGTWTPLGGTGTVAHLTSSGATISITNPTGPTVNIDVNPAAVIPSSAASGADVILSGGKLTLSGTTNVESLFRLNSLDQMTAPAAALTMAGSNGNQRITNLGQPAATSDATTALNSLLAATYYEPNGAVVKSTNSTTLVAIDTTNLTLPFTAISSVVVIELEGYAGNLTGGAQALECWGLFTHGTTTQVGYTVGSLSAAVSTTAASVRRSIRLTGLTAGTAYQVDWAWATGTGSQTLVLAVNAQTGASSSSYGPAIMRAFAG